MATKDDALDRLPTGARRVLDANWLGASTLPSRTLYPHQWNWDSAFIAMGRSWYDEPRAQQELRSLFRAQWADGRVPHIVFNPSVGEDAYFPGPAFWQSSQRSPAGAARRRDVGHHPAAGARPRRARDAPARARRRGVDGVPPLALPAPRRRARLPRRPPAARRDAACRCSCTRGSRASTTRRPGTATSPRWSSRPARSRPTYATTSTTPTPADRPDQRGLRPVRVPGRPLPRRRATTTPGCSTRCRSSSPGRCSTRSTCGRPTRWPRSPRSSGADPAPHREDAQRIHDALLADAVGPGDEPVRRPRRRPRTSAASRTRSSRSRRCSTPTCRRRSSTRSWPTSDRRSFHPGPARRLRGAELRPRWPRTSTSGATGAGPSGSTPTGCCGWASASTARTPRPRRSCSAACASSRGPASTSTSTRSAATAFGTDGFGWTAALTSTHRAATRDATGPPPRRARWAEGCIGRTIRSEGSCHGGPIGTGRATVRLAILGA